MKSVPSVNFTTQRRVASPSWRYFLVFVLSALVATTALAEGDAESPRLSSEIDKLKRVQVIIEQQGMEMPVHWQSRYPDKVLQRCSRFLDDLKAGHDIGLIEPVLRTDNPNDPSLARYQNACRNTKGANANYHKLSDIGAYGFRLYHVGIDGGTKDGSEEILYAEGNPRRSGNGAYYSVNFEQCTVKVLGHPCCKTTLPLNDSRIAITNINTFIRYDGSLFVLEIEGTKFKRDDEFKYGINLWPVEAVNALYCRFAWPYMPTN